MDTAGCSLAGLVSEFWQCGLAGARFGQNTKVLGESAGRDRSQARLCCVSVQGLLKAEGRKCRADSADRAWLLSHHLTDPPWLEKRKPQRVRAGLMREQEVVKD